MKKSIYLLPNLFTTGNLLCGFASVIASINGQYVRAAMAILIAAALDSLDGKVARMTNSASAFGVEYDSLADLLSFGLAPGLLLYAWILQPVGSFGWIAACLFVVCGALRLARFNVQAFSAQKFDFTGLPIPIAACMLASTVLLSQYLNGSTEVMDPERPLAFVLGVYALAFLMVSNFKYRSFKYLRLRRPKPLHVLLVAVVVVLIMVLSPAFSLFLIFLSYVISGPIEALVRRKKPEDEVATAEQ